MGRIVKEIEIDGKKLNALFDTGSMNTYILKRAVLPAELKTLKYPFHIGLGGEAKEIREMCVLEGEIEGLGFSTDAYIVDNLGEVDDKKLDAIIGARTMEGWEIKLDPKNRGLDLTGLRRREFTEY